jgi:hypothetical protein
MRKKNGQDDSSNSKLRKHGIAAAAAAALALSGATAAWADQAPPAKPAIPSLTDILTSTGITATGYVDATFSAFGYSGSQLTAAGTEGPASSGYNTFSFQQAGLTLAYQPASGFGALLNVVATPYASPYVNNYAPDSHYYLNGGSTPGSPNFSVFQGYAQYATGPWTVIAGKFSTLAGAEVYAPTGNTNVTRSILFTEEPLTHTGVRATYAPSGVFSFIIGVNNGWFNAGDQNSFGSDKTIEAGITLAPNKQISWALTNYYGRDVNLYGTTSGLELLDTVLTWNATSALSLIGTADYGNVASTSASPTASWWGVGGYVNYQFNPEWRLSLRAEYFDDQDGYLTDGAVAAAVPFSALASPGDERLKEATLTFGYDPTKHLELRIEGRYDAPDHVSQPAGPSVTVYSDTAQGWLEALWKF